MKKRKTMPAKYYDLEYYKPEEQRSTYKYKKAIKLANVKKDDVVLDFGCGAGRLVRECHSKVKKIWAYDFSRPLLNYAKNFKFNNVHYNLADVNNLNLTNKKFDVVFLLDVIEHLDDKDLFRLFEKIHRHLKEGGKLIIHTDCRWARYYKLFIRLCLLRFPLKLEEDLLHVNLMNPKDLRHELEKSGFADIKIILEKNVQAPNKPFKKWLYNLVYPLSASQWAICKK